MARDGVYQQVARVDGSMFGGPHQLAPLVERTLDAWRASLVVHIAGLPPQPAPLSYYDEFIERIGTPHDLAEDATVGDRDQQRVAARWMEVRFDPNIPNAYRHSAEGQPLHTDGSYIPSFPSATLMFCVNSASEGGETIFLDGADLCQILDERDPELRSRLESTKVTHRRSGDERTLPIIEAGREVLLNWNYYCVAPDVAPSVRQTVEDFRAFLRDEPLISEACIPVLLRPGEAVVWKDRRVLHGRNPFVAEKPSERFIWKCAVDVDVWA